MYQHQLVRSVKRITLPIAVLMTLFMGNPVHAATIVWDTPVTISGGSDVSTNGTQVFGRNIAVAYPGATAVVNGADFGYNNPNWAITFSDTATATAAGFGPAALSMGGPDGANYAGILNNSRFGSGAAAISFTLGNLTVGQEYELQFWVNDYRGFPNDRTETISASGNTNVNTPTLTFLDSNGPVHGQWVIGVWTADASSITFTVQGNETSQYNALQLRNITVPEPGAAALGAIGVLALLRRRRI